MQARLLPLLSLVCLVLSGCSAYSVHPLYTAQDAVVEPTLEGTWVSDSPNDPEFRVQKSAAHEYTLTILAPDTKLVRTYKVNLVRFGNLLFADMIFDGETLAGAKTDAPLGTVPMHVIVKLELTGDRLEYAVLDKEALEKRNTLEAVPLKLMETQSELVIADETAALRRYISVHAGEVFTDPDYLRRAPATP